MLTTLACAATTLLGTAAVLFAAAFLLSTLVALVVAWRIVSLSGEAFDDIPDIDDLDRRLG